MKLNSHTDLPIGEEKWLGPSHGQFCNRYLRRTDGIVELQHIYRHSQSSETQYLSEHDFDRWLNSCRKD